MILFVLLLLLAPACSRSADSEASTDDGAKVEKKDMATRAGEAVEGAKDRAQELTDEENKRVDDVNAAMND